MSREAELSEASEGTKSEPRVGHVIAGKYRIDVLLGEGGMGAVYAAQNLWTSRRVAVKLLRPELLSKPDTVRRFLQEARSASKIEHPNIVQVFDMGQDEADGTLFIVQELLQGTDLEGRLKQPEKLTLPEVSAILMPILDALEAAHSRGIIHRDLKPANIFLSTRSSGAMIPKLIDFGISKVLDDDGFQKTRTGTTVGTPYYMSPEQARGASSLDVRTDVWSIAAVLFEVLTGRGPFEAANYNQLIIKIVTERPPRVESLAPDTPRDLADVLHAALEPDLDKRLPTIRAFRDALRDCPSFCAPAADVPRPIGPTSLSSIPTPRITPTEGSVAHLDTLPSTPAPRPPDFDRSVPGQPVTVRPTPRGPMTLPLFAGAALLALFAVYRLRTASLSAPRSELPAPVNTPPPRVPTTPPPVALQDPLSPAPPALQPSASPPPALPPRAPPVAIPVADPPRPTRPLRPTAPALRPPSVRDAGTPPALVAQPPAVSPPAITPAAPGDLLRPAAHYPGQRPDAS